MIVDLRMVAVREDHDGVGCLEPAQYSVCLMAFPVPNNSNSKGVMLEGTEPVFKTEEDAQAYIDREAEEKGPWSVTRIASKLEKRNKN